MYNLFMNNGTYADAGYRKWQHPASRAVFVLIHGLGAHAGRWEAAAEFFLARGISSYAVEFNRYAPLTGPRPGSGYFDRFTNAVLGLRAIALKENPGKRIFLIGESMGALLSFLLATRQSGLFRGLVCISPAFASRVRLSPADYLKIILFFPFDPEHRIRLPFNSSMCTRDAGYRARLDADPREKRMAPVGLLVDVMLAQARAGRQARALKESVLFAVAGKDQLVVSQASQDLFRKLEVADKTLIEYPDMYHALSIDTDKERVFEDIVGWAEKRIS